MPLAMARNSAGKGTKEWITMIPMDAKMPSFPDDRMKAITSGREKRGHQKHQIGASVKLQNKKMLSKKMTAIPVAIRPRIMRCLRIYFNIGGTI